MIIDKRKLTDRRKIGVAIFVAMLTMLALNPHPASAEGGIWSYYTNMSIALVNLTNYKQTYVSDDWVYTEAGGCSGNQPLLDLGSDWQVPPYRTKTWSSTNGCITDPRNYTGSVKFHLLDLEDSPSPIANSTFTLHFAAHHASGLNPGSGTWVELVREPEQSYWSDVRDGFVYNRWSTAGSSVSVRPSNIMTLISEKFMVALYSPDNENIVIVVQQFYENQDGVIWDDTGTYVSYGLNFADNDAVSCPDCD